MKPGAKYDDTNDTERMCVDPATLVDVRQTNDNQLPDSFV